MYAVRARLVLVTLAVLELAELPPAITIQVRAEPQNDDRYMYMYLYIPGTQMTLVLNGKGLLLEGSDPKIEDKQVPGINIILYIIYYLIYTYTYTYMGQDSLVTPPPPPAVVVTLVLVLENW